MHNLAWELECSVSDLKYKVKSWYQRQVDGIVCYIQRYPKIAFLLFLEKDPKHSVIESSDIIIMVFSMCDLFVVASLACMYYGFKTFGVAGLFVSYAVSIYIGFLILHCIKDR